MASIIFSIVLNLFTCFNFLFILQYIFSGHMILSLKNLGISIPIFTFFILLMEVILPFDYRFIFLLLGVVCVVLLFSKNRTKDLLLLFPTTAFYMILQIIPDMFFTYAFPFFAQDLTFFGTTNSFLTFFGDPIMFVFLLVLRHILQKYEFIVNLSFKEGIGAVFLFFLSLVELILFVMVKRYCSVPAAQITFQVIFALAFILGIIYYLYNLVSSRIRLYHEQVARTETEYLKAQLDSLQDASEQTESARKLRHDLKNHLAIIETLCEQQQYDDLRSYTKTLSSALPSSTKALSGNQIADMILNSKMYQATEKKIDFTFEGNLSSLKRMEDPDICSLLANAYDNAIEACESQNKAYIKTVAAASRNFTTIKICNSVPDKVTGAGSSRYTTKPKKELHGYGIGIMKQIAAKYHGECTISCTKDEFSVFIYLPN